MLALMFKKLLTWYHDEHFQKIKMANDLKN